MIYKVKKNVMTYFFIFIGNLSDEAECETLQFEYLVTYFDLSPLQLTVFSA